MGGYFMPTSIGPSLSIPGLISQGITALSPILTRIAGTPAARSAATAISRAAGVVGTGAALGAGSSLTETILNRLLSGSSAARAGGAYGFRRRRRMNYCNARALRRSLRRVAGFSKFARKSFIFEKKVKIRKRRRS